MNRFSSLGNDSNEKEDVKENDKGNAKESGVMDPYPYRDMIRKPTELGVSDAGNLATLGNDIKAIQGYVNVLMSGDSNAQQISPLGTQYFFNTKTQCNDQTGVRQDRYAYVNNIPDHGMIGRGLVSGIVQDIAGIDPTALFNAFSAKQDTCQEITMTTRDNANISRIESRYVNNLDIEKYNPCWFPQRRNPVTQRNCEGMTNRHLPDDPIVKVYVAGIGAIAAFMVYRFMKK